MAAGDVRQDRPTSIFTKRGWTIPEFRSVGLAESKECHGFSVDKKNVFEIDGEAVRFLFQYAPKYVDMFSCNPAAYEQQDEIFSDNESVDSAAYCALSVQSFYSASVWIGVATHWICQTRLPSPALRHDSRRSHPIGFPSLPGLCFTEEC